eukprot:6210532-Pleurochrysis_carterae.AAC.2
MDVPCAPAVEYKINATLSVAQIATPARSVAACARVASMARAGVAMRADVVAAAAALPAGAMFACSGSGRRGGGVYGDIHDVVNGGIVFEETSQAGEQRARGMHDGAIGEGRRALAGRPEVHARCKDEGQTARRAVSKRSLATDSRVRSRVSSRAQDRGDARAR